MREPLPVSRRLVFGGVAVLIALKLLAAFTLRVNSDEPQHLHVVWAWTQGLLPYRDLFDNHAPLFHVLNAPLLAWIGERADIVPWMRCAVLPWYGLCLWLCFRLGRALFDARVALFGAALLALYPTFFTCATEFRPDDAWAAAWMSAIVFAVEGRPGARRAFSCGLLGGLAAAFSIKTAILIAAAVCAAAAIVAVRLVRREPVALRTSARLAAWIALGGAILPLTIACAFVLAGAGEAMFYCLIQHNTAAGLGRWQHHGVVTAIFPLLLAAALWVLYRYAPSTTDRRWLLRCWVACAGLFYLGLRISYQPLVDRQDVLPVIPMLAPFAAALILAATQRAARSAAIAAAAVLALETSLSLHAAHAWQDNARAYAAELGDLLRLSRPQEFVMDDKAESIFRPRPSYWVLENVTLYRLHSGSIADDLVQRLSDDRVKVGVFERETGDDRRFVADHYVAVAPHVSVLGHVFDASTANVEFDVIVPGRYAIVLPTGKAAGDLDGIPYGGARELAPGRHHYTADRSGPWALVWARAGELGFSPFPDRTLVPARGPAAGS